MLKEEELSKLVLSIYLKLHIIAFTIDDDFSYFEIVE